MKRPDSDPKLWWYYSPIYTYRTIKEVNKRSCCVNLTKGVNAPASHLFIKALIGLLLQEYKPNQTCPLIRTSEYHKKVYKTNWINISDFFNSIYLEWNKQNKLDFPLYIKKIFFLVLFYYVKNISKSERPCFTLSSDIPFIDYYNMCGDYNKTNRWLNMNKTNISRKFTNIQKQK